MMRSKHFLAVAGDKIRGSGHGLQYGSEAHAGHQAKLFSWKRNAMLEQAASGGGEEGNLHPWKFSRLC